LISGRAVTRQEADAGCNLVKRIPRRLRCSLSFELFTPLFYRTYRQIVRAVSAQLALPPEKLVNFMHVS
jgi:hypothetical protein